MTTSTKTINSVLIIDDEPTIRMLLSRIMELEGYEVFQAKDRQSGIVQLKKNNVQVVLCDVFLPDGNGVDMVKELLAISPASKIILLTAHGNITDGVQAIKNGAFDYIVKGDDNRKIIPIVSRAMDEAKIVKKSDVKSVRQVTSFDGIVGKSHCLQRAIAMARKVAATDVSVLLCGETGTGKEVFAQAIHQESLRKDKPFVAINCSAFSKELLESEIFGYKAGAFTGAQKDKKGLFEEADKGTIFLDEIGEMEFDLQAKLLRVLETGEFLKVGDTKPTKVDVRVISATNRNLKEEIERGRFREDLFFRMSVFQIMLPPLRERKEDIELLSRRFMEKLGGKMGRSVSAISPDCLELMQEYAWPGNVRELQNVIERALIVCDGVITRDDLPVDIQLGSGSSVISSSDFDLASVEKNHILRVLKYTGGNKTETARLLKIGLTTLYRKIEEYKINVSSV